MRRGPWLVVGALAFAGVSVASGALAQTDAPTTTEPTTTTRQPTTTSPPVTVSPTTAVTSTPTTKKPAAGGPTTTTTAVRGPKPPPASGASQPLDPSLLGGVPVVTFDTSTTLSSPFSVESDLTTTTEPFRQNAITVSHSKQGPSGPTLALAAVAWLASLGGLLVYAEDKRSQQWRHLAR